MRITCVIPTLGAGGAERVMIHLAAGLAERGHQVSLLTLQSGAADFYTVPENVKRIKVYLTPFDRLGLWGGFKRLLRLRHKLRQTKPDVVISFMALSVCMACRLARLSFIFADHLDIRKPPSFKWRLLRNWTLSGACATVVLSERDKNFVEKNYPRWKPALIYNPAFPAEEKERPRPSFLGTKRNVIAVGRLTKQKGFDILLRSWKRIAEKFPQWQLCIIGQGDEEAHLRRLIWDYYLQDCVQLIKPVQDIVAVYQHADLYVMSSRAEGFPMVLLEAMSYGLPVVSFQCNGPDVIVRDSVDGFLVPSEDEDALAEKLQLLMSDGNKRNTFAERAPEVVERFSDKRFLDAYEELCTNHPK